MSVIPGSGAHRYEVFEKRAKLPDDWEFKDAFGVPIPKGLRSLHKLKKAK